MLKQMRWCFIGAAKAAFAAGVLTLLCFVNVWNYYSVTRQQDETLSWLMEVEDQKVYFPPEVQYSRCFFSVFYAPDGSLCTSIRT